MNPNTLQQNLTRRSLDFWREEGARAARVITCLATDAESRFAQLYDGHKVASATCHIAPDDRYMAHSAFTQGFKAASSLLY